MGGRKILSVLLLGAMLCGALIYHLFVIPSIVWRSLFVVLCLVCVAQRGSEHQLSALEKALLVFLGVNFLYYGIALSNMTATSMSAIGSITMALLSMSAFAFLSNHGEISSSMLTVAFVVLLVGSVEFFYHMRSSLLLEGIFDEDDGLTNNASVAFVVLLPWLFLIKNRWIALGGFLVCLFHIVYGAKRGDIVASVIPVMLFIYSFARTQKGWWRKLLFVMAIVTILGLGIWQFFQEDEYLQERLMDTIEGNSSGRDTIFRNAWECWYYADDAQFWLGHGFLSTISLIGKAAHNDWLEVLVDYGLLGVMVYGAIFYFFVRCIRREHNFSYRMVLLASLSIWILKSLYSMAYLEALWAVLLAPAGIVIGQNRKRLL